MHTLLEKGTSFSLDDYGMGYSNLSYLLELSFKLIKIDKSMVSAYCNMEKVSVKLLAKMLEPYNSLELLSKNLANMMKSSFSDYAQEIINTPESLKTISSYIKRNSSFIGSYVLIDSFSAPLHELSKTVILYLISSIAETVSFERISSELLKQLHEIDNSALLSQSSSLSQIADKAYSIIQDDLSMDKYPDEGLTEEENKTVLQEQILNPNGFQERVANWMQKR